ncbi:MAG: hypothetical protein P4L53_03930 [Candidatus Obscuribacterales bacterium]|nr:hypothetical protein [Candidatus Obscuribacterales bacterium]
MRTVGSINIGSLLLQAELIKKSDLESALPLSKRMKLPLGRVLVITGFVSDRTLNAALAAQSLIRDKAITLDIALKALKEAEKNDLSFEQMLLQYGISTKLLEYTNKLGQLLIDSDFISEKQRSEALQMALISSLPLGRILVLQKVINNVQAYAALSAQILIRTGEISREQAIVALMLTKDTNRPFEVALKDGGFINSQALGRIMLGELLVISDQLSEVNFLTCLEKSLIENIPLGRVLVDAGFLSANKLERALSAQKQISDGQMTQADAAEYINAGFKNLEELSDTKNRKNGSMVRLGELLVLCKIITYEQVVNAYLTSVNDSMPLETALRLSGTVESAVLIGINSFLQFYLDHKINAEELLVAISSWMGDRQTKPEEVVRRVLQQGK